MSGREGRTLSGPTLLRAVGMAHLHFFSPLSCCPKSGQLFFRAVVAPTIAPVPQKTLGRTFWWHPRSKVGANKRAEKVSLAFCARARGAGIKKSSAQYSFLIEWYQSGVFIKGKFTNQVLRVCLLSSFLFSFFTPFLRLREVVSFFGSCHASGTNQVHSRGTQVCFLLCSLSHCSSLARQKNDGSLPRNAQK